MKKCRLILGVCVLAMMLTFFIAAEAATSGKFGTDLQWEISDDGTLTISAVSETGKLQTVGFFNNPVDGAKKWPWYEDRNKIEKVVIKDGVSTGNAQLRYMFYDCDKLESVDFSGLDANNLDAMNDMFRGCDALEDVVIEAKNFQPKQMGRMFQDCKKLKKRYFGNGR